MRPPESEYSKEARAALAGLIDTLEHSSDGEEKVQEWFDAVGVAKSMFEVRTEDLMEEYGLTRISAQAIGMLGEITRFVGAERTLVKRRMKTCAQVSPYLMALMYGRKIEYCYLLCLNRAGNFAACPLLQRGTVDQSAVYMREMALTAVENHAAYCVLSHNHPSGGLLPSAADIDVTTDAIEALRSVGIALLDHVIVTDRGSTSIRSLGRPAERMWRRGFENDRVMLNWLKDKK